MGKHFLPDNLIIHSDDQEIALAMPDNAWQALGIIGDYFH
jgi:hypothetical protein